MKIIKIALLEGDDNVHSEKILEMEEELNRLKEGRRLFQLASRELHEIVEGKVRIMSSVVIHYQLSLHLEMLMDECEEVRKKAFGELKKFIHIVDCVLDERKHLNLKNYFEFCGRNNHSFTNIFDENQRKELTALLIKAMGTGPIPY